MAMWSEEEGARRWSLAQIALAGDFFVAPLASQRVDGSSQPRHEVHSAERGLLCWDARGSALVKVCDWFTDEYWGERVLVVEERAPQSVGLTWKRRQSDLWELGQPWQGVEARVALSRLGTEEKKELCTHMACLWRATSERADLESEVQKPMEESDLRAGIPRRGSL